MWENSIQKGKACPVHLSGSYNSNVQSDRVECLPFQKPDQTDRIDALAYFSDKRIPIPLPVTTHTFIMNNHHTVRFPHALAIEVIPIDENITTRNVLTIFSVVFAVLINPGQKNQKLL